MIGDAEHGEDDERGPAAHADDTAPPVRLDDRRGMNAQKATEIRRRTREVERDQAALRRRQAELESFLLAAPSLSWPDVAEKASYLIRLLATTEAGRDPRRRKIIASVLADLRRLSGAPEPANDPS